MLGAAETCQRFRQRTEDFTRTRVVTFVRVVILILRGHKVSLQNALNKFFTELGAVFQVPTASAYCQARQKLKPEVYVHLNEVVCGDFYRLYEAERQVRRWRGHRLLAADGTTLNVPDTPATRQRFSVQSNQLAGSDCVQALASVLYDLLNELGLAAGLGAKQAEKGFLFETHWSATEAGDVLVLDRAYADYTVIAWAFNSHREVVIRFPRGSFTAVNQFWHSAQRERLVTVYAPARARAFVKAHHLPTQLRLRLLKVLLPSGEVEVLGTTLLDRQAYPSAEFKQVYGWRWGEETFFDRLKNVFELERFSGTSLSAIEQDFYGVVFLATLDSVLSKPAQEALNTRAPACAPPAEVAVDAPVRMKVNRAVSYLALIERVSALLAHPGRSPASVLAELQHLLQTTPTRLRPGRQVPRPKLSHAKRLWFQRYVKRLIA